MREAFVDALLAARRADDRTMVLDADCAKSTRNQRFAESFPDSFLNVGIAEQNLVGMAAGMALAGRRPVACAFAAILVARAGEQILQSVCLPGLGVKLAGHYSGMSGAREGAPHHSVCDLAFLRAAPGMSIFVPSDDADVAGTAERFLDVPGPAYIRLARDPVQLPSAGTPLGDGLRVWGGGDEVVIVACGVGVQVALDAQADLAGRGISAAVVAVSRLKPLPVEALTDLVAGASLVVTVEDHSIVGGLGSAVAEMLVEHLPLPLLRAGIPDTFTETGSHTELLHRYGLDPTVLAQRVERRLEKGPAGVGSPR